MESDQNSDIIPFTFQLTELANCMERVCFCFCDSSCASLVGKINLFLERERAFCEILTHLLWYTYVRVYK